MPAVHLDKASFERLVIDEKRTAIIDFWAPRCAPCRMLGPVVEQVAEEVPEGVLVGKVDADQEPELSIRYGVMAIPTLISFKDGKEVRRTVGLTGKEEILALLN